MLNFNLDRDLGPLHCIIILTFYCAGFTTRVGRSSTSYLSFCTLSMFWSILRAPYKIRFIGS